MLGLVATFSDVSSEMVLPILPLFPLAGIGATRGRLMG